MVRGLVTTQTHWISSATGASPSSACSVGGLSAAMGSDRCNAVTHIVPRGEERPRPAHLDTPGPTLCQYIASINKTSHHPNNPLPLEVWHLALSFVLPGVGWPPLLILSDVQSPTGPNVYPKCYLKNGGRGRAPHSRFHQ